MLKRAEVEAEEERLRARARALPRAQRAAFHREATRVLRDPDTYAVLNWFLVVGLHHFYLGRWARGALDVAAVAVAIPLALAGELVAAAALVGAVAVAELWALFRAQIIVQAWNNRRLRGLLERHEREAGQSA